MGSLIALGNALAVLHHKSSNTARASDSSAIGLAVAASIWAAGALVDTSLDLVRVLTTWAGDHSQAALVIISNLVSNITACAYNVVYGVWVAGVFENTGGASIRAVFVD